MVSSAPVFDLLAFDPRSRMSRAAIQHLPVAIEACFADLRNLNHAPWPPDAGDRIALTLARLAVAFPPSRRAFSQWRFLIDRWDGSTPLPLPWDPDAEYECRVGIVAGSNLVARLMAIQAIAEILTGE